MARRLLTGLLLMMAAAVEAAPVVADDAAGNLPIQKGDHISLIGNTLADRMQHDGWLETYLQARFPQHELTIRNLGYAADELTIRLRSADFGTPDEWLTKTKTDVVLAFFGYNESFGDLEKFKKDLADFITHTLAQKYNGSSAPRLVLFSPIAHEDLKDRSLPDGKENNVRLEALTNVMGEVARAHNVRFVDLFHPTQAAFAAEHTPYTINGIHLTADGNRMLATIIDDALFPEGPKFKRSAEAVEALRQAVLDKNFHWFNRYRTVDGYSIYGGRADLSFTNGQTNRVVMQREMEILDEMTANRDKKIWAVANGGNLQVDDSNTQPFIPVITNKPGAGPNGEHIFIDGEDAIQQMTLGKGLKINLFASEKEFPDLAKPVQISFDSKGRLFVACWPSYPHWKPKAFMNDKILILEDTDGDGKADKQTVFADRLHCPIGFEIVSQGVLVSQGPNIMLLKDTDGDDVADVREHVLSGLDTADTHHTSNSFHLDPGGALYFQEGTFHHTQVETPYGPPARVANAGVFRYEPRSQKFEVYVTYGFANPHGHSFDRWGVDFVTDGTGNVNYYAPAFSGHLDYPSKHRPMKAVFPQRTRPSPGTEILSSRQFPEDWQGDYLVGNVIGFQGIHRYKLKEEGSGFGADEMEPIVFSSDPNFRPSDIEMGPDGGIYFAEWQNPIIGHMQHNLRDPSRDQKHGRVYRVTYEGRPLLTPPSLAGLPIESLLDLLKEPEDRLRYRVRVELGARDTNQVLAALKAWTDRLDPNDQEYEHRLMEALWVHQFHDTVNVELLDRLLTAKEFRARAAATRVLCYWRDRVPNALSRLKTLAADPEARVRLEAVRAASFFTEPEALEVPLITAEYPTDYYLDYTRTETMRALDPYVKKAIAEGRPLEITSKAGERYFLREIDASLLLKMKRNRGVLEEILFRPGIREEDRRQALADLSRLVVASPPAALSQALRDRDGQASAPAESVVIELARIITERPVTELTAARGELARLVSEARSPIIRQFGFASLIAADGSVDQAWSLATQSTQNLRDFLGVIPLIRDPSQRSSLYSKVEPLLHGLPASLAEANQGKGSLGRYVRIELPRNGTLTLAEVEVMSGGKNIARQGKTSQKNTSYGGDASHAIDGNTSPDYSKGGQTHTAENTRNPWWEVDLGAEASIESINVYNRVEGSLGERLRGFTLLVLDNDRNPVFQKKDLPEPEPVSTVTVDRVRAEDVIRRAAMSALADMRGHEPETFKALAKFVRDGVDRATAVAAIQKIPAAYWPVEEAKPLLESLISGLQRVPTAERTTPAALAELQLGDALAALLPADQAKPLRKALSSLGVRVIRVGTVLEQMRFDVDVIVVEAGKPVEILFSNSDTMPHNFVVTQPGSLEEVGLLGEATATQPDALKRQYVPASDKILLSSRLLQPRESQKISFNAPGQAGVYPYVCTYPAHWRRMYGSLYVVENLDDYLASPESYLAAHPVTIRDELLKSNRPRKEWTFDDLSASVAQLGEGRSHANGKQLFQLATCVSCHKLEGAGNEFGPDLAKLDPKQSPAELLQNILDPSSKINEKFVSYLFEMENGQVLSGLIVSETPDEVRIVENPLASTEPKVLKKSEIENRKPSPTSLMPKGLLDKLTREEILDLIAYLTAGGDPAAPVFQGGHSGGHGHGGGH